ncbi:ATP-binding cassette domain-containing protein, partial [Desulfovibrio sp. 1214_IL3152]|uniref:ATP-binding cassette domain-containing protein n=1 Tax=Desulfovibrio sp. 1214_IL3152 TaxID=3084056 RepID=UPI002FD8B484
GEQGLAISGGQRQSVALARALLHDPEVLILDEPTSNMDKASESQLLTRLAKLSESKTLVLITHRASLLALVNRLIIVDNGRVVADGPRDKVLEAIASQKQKRQAPGPAGEEQQAANSAASTAAGEKESTAGKQVTAPPPTPSGGVTETDMGRAL